MILLRPPRQVFKPLWEGEGQEAAAALDHEPGDGQPVQKSRKPRHKRWGPDKDAPDPAAPAEDPALAASSSKPKRKRWGPDAPTPEPEEEPAPIQEEPAKGRRKRWGPEEPQAQLSAPADEPAQQPEAHTDASEAEQAEAKKSKKRRWGPEEPAAEAAAAASAATSAPAPQGRSTLSLSYALPVARLHVPCPGPCMPLRMRFSSYQPPTHCMVLKFVLFRACV